MPSSLTRTGGVIGRLLAVADVTADAVRRQSATTVQGETAGEVAPAAIAEGARRRQDREATSLTSCCNSPFALSIGSSAVTTLASPSAASSIEKYSCAHYPYNGTLEIYVSPIAAHKLLINGVLFVL